MFIGHYAPALAAATLPRAPRLAWLFVAAQLAEIAFCLLALAGLEHYAIAPFTTAMSPLVVYDAPWSHSLLGTLTLAAAFMAVVRLADGGTHAAWIGAAVVAAAWPLDLLTHAPDLTLAGGGERHGLGLWNHPYVAMPLELGLTFLALAFYAERTRPRGRAGTATLVLLGVAMTGLQLWTWLDARGAVAADPAPAAASLRPLAACVMLATLAWWTAETRYPVDARAAGWHHPPMDKEGMR